MAFFALAFGLLLYVLAWGLGLALLISPRPYRRYWVFLMPAAGLGLQSAIVWLGAFAGLPGTDSYARLAVAIPIALLGWALASRERRSAAWHGLAHGVGAGAVMLVALGAMVTPLALKTRDLTTASIASCDAADYAAGARAFMEFSRRDRVGLLGEAEVVGIGKTDNFYDFWLRLNHFTPSALIALNASTLRLQPYQVTGVFTAVILALGTVMVFWIARALLRLGAVASGGIALLYGLGPLNLYAVYQVAIGQLLAAPAIALLTWIGVTAWREGATWRRGLAWSGLLVLTYWLILGSYNFIIVVSLVPAIGFAGGHALWRRRWPPFRRWLVIMLAPLAACGVVFTERALGLVERFLLFKRADFGWHIPLLTPEIWYGLVASARLHAFFPALRIVASALLLLSLAAALVFLARRRSHLPFLAACIAIPALVGYSFLYTRGVVRGTNASYDGYKLFSVFYPCLLPVFCLWLAPGRRSAGPWRWLAVALSAMLATGNLLAVSRFVALMRIPPLVVRPEMVQLRQIERNPRVHSVNLLLARVWARLWADAFLLRTPQYFAVATYEGRRATPLRGEWDLSEQLLVVETPNPEDRIEVNSAYALLNTRSPYFLRASFGPGWYGVETFRRQDKFWCWSHGDAGIVLLNPHPYPLAVRGRFVVSSIVPRDLELALAGTVLWSGHIANRMDTAETPIFLVAPGRSEIRLHSNRPPVHLGPPEFRALGVSLYRFEFQVLGIDGVPP